MKKIFVLSLLFYSMVSMAITVDDFNNVCGLYAYDNMYATFAPAGLLILMNFLTKG